MLLWGRVILIQNSNCCYFNNEHKLMVHLKRASMLILDVEIKCLTFIKTTHMLMFIHLNLKINNQEIEF